VARKVHTTQKELEDVLHCRISKFTLDNLINVASKLLTSSKIEIIIGQKARKSFHVPIV
jgi:predicted XRE-type DNA-binding protein